MDAPSRARRQAAISHVAAGCGGWLQGPHETKCGSMPLSATVRRSWMPPSRGTGMSKHSWPRPCPRCQVFAAGFDVVVEADDDNAGLEGHLARAHLPGKGDGGVLLVLRRGAAEEDQPGQLGLRPMGGSGPAARSVARDSGGKEFRGVRCRLRCCTIHVHHDLSLKPAQRLGLPAGGGVDLERHVRPRSPWVLTWTIALGGGRADRPIRRNHSFLAGPAFLRAVGGRHGFPPLATETAAGHPHTPLTSSPAPSSADPAVVQITRDDDR